jgi:hypothetical protein
MGAILSKGLSIIRGVQPKSNRSTKLKAEISKNVGRISKKDSESEALAEELLALEEKGGDPEAIKKAKKELEDIRASKKKYPKEVGEINTGEEFVKETEYKKGGRVKKNKGGLIRGIPKLATRGY